MVDHSTTAIDQFANDVNRSSAPTRRLALPGWSAQVTAILGGCALILWHASRFGFWIVDDAAITFAYVRNITDGHGSVLQPGADPTEGFSNPTWLALLSMG